MSKITIIEGNSNDKDNVRAIMVKGEKGDMGDLNHNDIIDNLTSTATNKVLSAKQGKVLKDLVDTNTSNISTNAENISTNATNISNETNARQSADTTLQNNINSEATARANADVTLQSQISGLASGSPKPVSNISQMTDTTKTYVLTTDGKWYYYNGTQWVAGGVYQATEDSDTLKILENKVENISNTTNNIFDMCELLKANGWSYENGIYTGTGLALANTFNSSNFIVSMLNTIHWRLEFDVYTDGNQSSTGSGLRFNFVKSDSTTQIEGVSNAKLTWEHYIFKSPDNNEIPYLGIYFTNGPSSSNNIWHLKNINLTIESNEHVDYEPHYTAVDIEARKSINNINQKLNNEKIVARAMKGDSFQIKLIGDSITAGVGGTGYNADASGGGNLIYGTHYQNILGKCWANSLKSYVENKFGNVTVINNGVSGVKSADLVSHFNSLVNNSDDVIIVMIGTNDRGLENPKEILYNNLVSIYNKIKTLNKKMIVMANIPASVSNETSPAPNIKNMHMEDVDMVINSFAIDYNIPYISVYKLFIEYCKYMNITIDSLLNDGLHPNDTGYDVMFYLISNKLGFSTERPEATW